MSRLVEAHDWVGIGGSIDCACMSLSGYKTVCNHSRSGYKGTPSGYKGEHRIAPLPGSYFMLLPQWASEKKRKEKKRKRKEKEKKKKRKRRREKKKRKEREREENAGAARSAAGLGGQVHLAVRWPTGNFRPFLLCRDSRARG